MSLPLMNFPTRVHFGAGSVRLLPLELSRLGAHRPLVIADRGVVGAGLLRRVVDVLEAAGFTSAVFDRVEANPTERHVHEALEAYRAGGCDSVVGLGGGSPLAVAKLTRLAVHHPPPLDRYAEATGGDRYITTHLPPMIAVPTTAGPGTDVSSTAVVFAEAPRRRLTFQNPRLVPDAALLDAELTLGLPAFITAATGLDALANCIEGYISNAVHPFAEAIALAGVSRISKHLLRCVKDGQTDVHAREQMLLGSSMGGIAAQKGLGTAHALAHAIAPIAGLHHGLANALVLPTVLAFNREAAAERLADVAVALGYEPRASQGERAAAASELVRKLVAASGLVPGLGAHGVRADSIPAIAQAAFDDPSHRTSPRPATLEDFAKLLRDSM